MKTSRMLQSDIPGLYAVGIREGMMHGWNRSMFYTEEQLERMHASDDTRIFVSKEHRRIIGFLILIAHRSSGNAIITHFFVEQSYRNKGVREQLFNCLRESLEHLGVMNTSLIMKMVNAQGNERFLATQCVTPSSPIQLFQIRDTPVPRNGQ